MKVSVCITVLNEETSITQLLDSLVFQTRTPDEIVIVDGGSTDYTVAKIKKYQHLYPLIKLYIKAGSVAVGRNYSIKKASYEYIALTDAGCIAEPDWLDTLCKSAKKGDIIAGFYDMKARNSFQKAMASYRGVIPKNLDKDTYIPSARSVLFKKDVWRKLKGFREDLSLSGEDTDFFYRAQREGFKFYVEDEAIVNWVEPGTWTLKDLKKFYYYAKGDVETGIWWNTRQGINTHNIKVTSIFIRYIIFISVYAFLQLIALCFFILYLILSCWKVYRKTNDFQVSLWAPIIQVVSDILIMIGFVAGAMRSKRSPHV